MRTSAVFSFLLVCSTIGIDVLCISLIKRFSCPVLKLSNGRVRYRQRTGFAQFQCNRSFLLAGEKYMKCTHGKWEGESPTCVRNTCIKPKEPTHGFVYPSHRGGVLNVFCKPEYKLAGTPSVFCNGTHWSSYLPSCLPNNHSISLTCDFESEDLCGWSHDINDNFDWTRMQFSTPSGHIGTGPKQDHTPHKNGQGYYMYIEASSRNINDTARLISPVYEQDNNNTCFEFFYHMYGAAAGELRVYLKKVGDSSWDLNPDDAIFRRDGNQGNAWRRKLINLGSIDDDFQIVIEAVRGYSYLSDIAIDDVRIIENCVEVEVEDEESTSVFYELTTDPFMEETCTNRCFNEPDANGRCDCNSDCSLLNRCCPDYEAVCILGDLDETTMETTTDDIRTTQDSDNSESNDVMQAASQATIYNVMKPIATITTLKKQPTTNKPQPTKLILTTTAKTTKKPHTTKKILIPIMKSTTNFTIKTIATTAATKMMPTSKKTLKPNDGRHNEILNDVATLPANLDYEEEEKIVLTLTTAARAVEKSQKIVKLKNQADSTISTAVLIIAVTIVTGVIVTVLLLKRRYMCMRFRNMRNGSHGDSQSDVRFLTSDEVLDFTLQTSD